MKPDIKICGLSTSEAVDAAVCGAASHIGFIFFEKSPRNVSVSHAARLAANRGRARSVAVTVNAGNESLDKIVETMQPDVLQLHGSETPERIYEIRERYGLPVMKALAIRNAKDLTCAEAYEAVADMLLFDAKPPENSDLPGGNGVSFDWSLLAGYKSERIVLLSGGINLDNVEQAMQLVSDPSNTITGLDISSGVESSPGVKDTSKIEAFLAACAVPETA